MPAHGGYPRELPELSREWTGFSTIVQLERYVLKACLRKRKTETKEDPPELQPQGNLDQWGPDQADAVRHRLTRLLNPQTMLSFLNIHLEPYRLFENSLASMTYGSWKINGKIQNKGRPSRAPTTGRPGTGDPAHNETQIKQMLFDKPRLLLGPLDN